MSTEPKDTDTGKPSRQQKRRRLAHGEASEGKLAGPVRPRRGPGRLAGIMDLPIDVLYEVCVPVLPPLGLS